MRPPDPALGPERAAQIALASPLTTVAIGGIDAGNLRCVLALGFVNFAVVRAVCAKSDPRTSIAKLRATWHEYVA
jgi:thiamine monophosphate synthase